MDEDLRKEMNSIIEHGHTAWAPDPSGHGKDHRIQQHTTWDHPEFLKRIGEDMKRQFRFEYKLAERGEP